MTFNYQDFVNRQISKQTKKASAKENTITFEKLSQLIKKVKQGEPYNLYTILEKYAKSHRFGAVDDRAAMILSQFFSGNLGKLAAMEGGKPAGDKPPIGEKPPVGEKPPPAQQPNQPPPGGGGGGGGGTGVDLYKALTVSGPILSALGLIGIMASENKTLWGIVFLLGAAALAAGVTKGFTDFNNMWSNFTGPWGEFWNWIKSWFPGGGAAPAAPAPAAPAQPPAQT
jgi:hypothetical protein